MIQEKILLFKTDNEVFGHSKVTRLHQEMEVKTASKPAIKPYSVERDLELEFELEQELLEQLNNFLAEERYYVQDFKTKMKYLFWKRLKHHILKRRK